MIKAVATSLGIDLRRFFALQLGELERLYYIVLHAVPLMQLPLTFAAARLNYAGPPTKIEPFQMW